MTASLTEQLLEAFTAQRARMRAGAPLGTSPTG
jgi:hypothetical protein